MIQYSKPSIKLSEKDRLEITKIIDSGNVSIGKYTAHLEEIIKNRFGVKHVIACSNATSGLIIAAKATGFKNKRVAVQAFTWPSTIYALECNGNTPVFCDIDKDTWLIDEQTAKQTIDVVMSVDTFGAQSREFLNFPCIIDAAHGFDIPNLGHRGLVEVVSLSFTKPVTAMEGGLILTNSDQIASTAKELRRLSARMSEVNAYIAIQSVCLWDMEAADKRSHIVKEYKKNLNFKYKTQANNINNSVFSILLPTEAARNKILRNLSLAGVETKIYYEPIVEGLQVTDEIYSKSIALPIHISLTDEDIKIITSIANEAVASCPGKDYLQNYLRKTL